MLSARFPVEERLGITSYLRRANELETQLELAKLLSFCAKEDYNEVVALLVETRKILSRIRSVL